jgi:hypothetical protein
MAKFQRGDNPESLGPGTGIGSVRGGPQFLLERKRHSREVRERDRQTDHHPGSGILGRNSVRSPVV